MSRQRGFSLIELSVVVSLFAVLMLFIIPTLSSFSNTYQLMVGAESVATEFQLARFFAVSRNQVTQIDYVDTNGSVIPSSSIPPSTSPNARLSFIQNSVRGVRVSDDAGNQLRPNVFLPSDVYLTGVPDSQIKFSSRGTLQSGAGTINARNATGEVDVNLSGMGRIRIIDQRAY